jgi:NADH:ubiquinone reductase (H+-translocating)
MLYTPLLPEAAAGSIEPRHVTVPLRAMCPDAELLLGAAVAIDPDGRTVEVESEAGRFTVAYDELVVALGSVTRLPDVHELSEHALQLKDLTDAIRLRNHVLRQIELADAAPETAAERLTFVLPAPASPGSRPSPSSTSSSPTRCAAIRAWPGSRRAGSSSTAARASSTRRPRASPASPRVRSARGAWRS